MALQRNALQPFESSAITAAGWDERDGTLTISFTSGKCLDYDEVPEEIWENFKAAGSQGKYYNTHIKGKFAGSPHEER
jgi:hypothetical protein